ncbi:MAG: hypothetical protein QXU18_07595 [Thermoplasmatales archaeon]
MAYKDTASFGKRQEYSAIAELLKRGLDVYMTLVDDQGIDCVIRRERNGEPDYLDIQIKARSKDCKPYDAARFSDMKIVKPRKNLWFIFYSEQLDKYWIINSLELIRMASLRKGGKTADRWNINLAGYSKSGVVTAYDRFSKYENDEGFKQLE